jgi:uncharacterized protein YndB with AHSA1/START domain
MRVDVDLEACRWASLAVYALEDHDRHDSWSSAGVELRPARARAEGVRVTKGFRAPPERVFAAWLNANSAGTWLFATAARPIAEVDIDARIGGAFRFLERRRRSSTEYAGRYLAIVPSRRLAFTLALDGGRISTVTIDIAPRRSGCALVLRHQPVPSCERQRTEARWTGILYGLELMLDAEIPYGPTRSQP